MQPTSDYLTFNREINVLDPVSFTPNMEEVFRALPKINRFNGQTSQPYSVALHSCWCAYMLEHEYDIHQPHLVLAILLHDAAEAYIGDIVRPIKNNLNKEVFSIEETILHKIYLLCNFTDDQMKEIYSEDFQKLLNEIDNCMGATEADALRAPEEKGTVLPDVERYKDFILAPKPSWEQEEWLLSDLFKSHMKELNNEK